MRRFSQLRDITLRGITMRGAILLALLEAARGGIGQDVFRCSSADGQMSYQDHPCNRTQQQRRLSLPKEATLPVASSTSAHSALSFTTVAPATSAAVPPTASPPILYGCVRATDGKPYLSEVQTPPYYAPLAMVDGIPGSMSAAGSRARPSGAMVANNYTPVQDACHLLSPAETCAALRDEYDQLDSRLRRAFKNEQAALEPRAQALRDQLDRCRGI